MENTNTVSKEAPKSAETIKTPPPLTGFTKANEIRESIVSKYNKANGVESEPESETSAQKPVEKGAEQPPKSDTQPSPVKADPSPEDKTEEKPEVKEEPQEKPKGDLQKALHEARDKNKKLNLFIREKDSVIADLKAKNEELQVKVNKLMEDPESLSRPSVTGNVTEEELVKERELAELRQKNAKYLEQENETKRREAQEQHEKKISRVADELEADGYPGFDLSLVAVDKAIMKRYQEGDFSSDDIKDEKNWKTVFIEDVYPKLQEKFLSKKEKETVEAKKAAKGSFKSVTSPGSTPKVEDPEEENLSYDEYTRRAIEQRRKHLRT